MKMAKKAPIIIFCWERDSLILDQIKTQTEQLGNTYYEIFTPDKAAEAAD